MFVFGNKNLKKLIDTLIIPDVAVKVTQYWIFPIYKVDINYGG